MSAEAMPQTRFKYALSWILWPLLMFICMGMTIYGFSREEPLMVFGMAVDQKILYFNIAYIFLIISLWRLEIYMPHEQEWMKPDGQNFASIMHTLSSKGTVQLLLLYSTTIGLADMLEGPGGLGIWPHDWPLWAQVMLAVVAAEFGLYWAHRAGHEWAWVWRFHAVHHSVEKLWFLNTGRFHFVDSLISIVLGMVILMILGAPLDMVMWGSAITAFIGLLTHCNVEMRFGWLNYIFNTPGLHRWHHSKDLKEGNRNYCENVMIWDHVFRTFYDADYRPPADIGMKDYMPKAFWKQLLWPFLPARIKERLEPDFEYLPFIKEEK